MDNKGIFNIEILMSMIVLLFIFSMIISISMSETTSIEETQNRKESRIITSDISSIIQDVYNRGDGYHRTYELPDKINEETYILIINNSGIYINSHYQITYSKIFSHNIVNQKYVLESGNIYEFINNNETIEIIKKY